MRGFVALTCGVDTSTNHHSNVQQGNCNGADRVSQRGLALNWSASGVLIRESRIIPSPFADILEGTIGDLLPLAYAPSDGRDSSFAQGSPPEHFEEASKKLKSVLRPEKVSS
jgi:hypothetical protein